MIAPVIEALATSTRPAWIANTLTISSVAFPKVAFKRPPIAGFVLVARSSVASPIYLASGIIAAADIRNMTSADAWRYSATNATGISNREKRKNVFIP
jgi:hypothetical protein